MGHLVLQETGGGGHLRALIQQPLRTVMRRDQKRDLHIAPIRLFQQRQQPFLHHRRNRPRRREQMPRPDLDLNDIPADFREKRDIPVDVVEVSVTRKDHRTAFPAAAFADGISDRPAFLKGNRAASELPHLRQDAASFQK